MAAITAAITAGVALAGLAYTIDSSEQAKRSASQKEDGAKLDANSAMLTKQKQDADTQMQKQALASRDAQRRRLASGGIAGPQAGAAAPGGTLLGAPPSPGSTTLLGS